MNIPCELRATVPIGYIQNRRTKSAGYSRLSFWAILMMLVLCVPTCIAQGTISVLGGKVFDSQKNVIQGGEVTVTSDDTGVVYTAKTSEVGSWRVDGLIAGRYHFTVSAPGFESLIYPTFEVQMASQKFIDVTLQVGQTTDSVTVTADAPLIDTSAAVSGTVMNNEDFEQIPSATNSPIEFVRLTPGVFLGDTSSGSAFLWSNGSMSGTTVNGAGSGKQAVNYMLDGATNTKALNGEMAFIPSVDSIKEMRVTTNAYDASISRAASGTVNMTMKSGGKDFHGTLYARNGNNIFNANSVQNNISGAAKSTIHMNEWGGTVGGPVYLPKLYNGRAKNTFFFVSYDGIRNVSPYATGTLSLPNAAERTGDFSSSFTTATVSGVTTSYPVKIYDPLTATSKGDRTEFANATIPANRLSPIAKAFMKQVPLPNRASDGASTDSNNYLINDPKIDDFWAYTVRGDQAWNNNHHSYAEYRHNHFKELGTDVFGPENPLAGVYQLRINDGITLNHVWVVSPTLLVNLNGNLTSFQSNQYSKGKDVDPKTYGFSSAFAASQSITGLPYIDGLFTTIGSHFAPQYENDYSFEGKGSIEQSYRNHVLHYGIEYMTQQVAAGTYSDASGYYKFSNIWTTQNPNNTAGTGVGSTNASFLLGLAASGDVKTNATSFFSQPYLGIYVQDDWRATPKLTLNFGLRWDYQFPLVERHDKYWSRFDPNYNLTAITSYSQPLYAAAIGGSSTNLGIKMLQANRSDASNFVARGAILYAGLNGTSRSITDAQFRYIQPRIGFAYQLYPNTVLRGGVGRFVQANFIADHASQTGFSSTSTFDPSDDNYITPASSLDNPYPSGLTAVTGNSLGVYTNPGSVSSFYSANAKRQYVDDVSLHLQQQFKDYLFEIGGVFDYTNNLPVDHYINDPSLAAWHASYDAKFDTTGRPVDTLPGDTKVTNPFKGAPYITNSLKTNSTISAYQLVRPNPLLGALKEVRYDGKSWHYSMQTKVQRRMRNGFSVSGTFSWNKQMDQIDVMTPTVVAQKPIYEISVNDRRFQFVAAPTYTLPFGQGKLIGKNSNHLVDGFIGGWELSAEYIFWSGTPLKLPTNSAFFKGGDPSLGSGKSTKKWFDTSKFVAFPTVSTTVAQLTNTSLYPAWTGVASLPGYSWVPTSSSDASKNGVYQDFSTWSTNNPVYFGTVRSPFTNNWNIGLRKTVSIHKDIKLQLRADAFNALNHPRYANPNLTASSAYFGYLNGSSKLAQSNDPRAIQVQGKIYF